MSVQLWTTQFYPPKLCDCANTPTEALIYTHTHTHIRWTSSQERPPKQQTQSHVMRCMSRTEAACVLTLGLGADQAGWGVTERAQDGSYGQAQVLVARVQSDRGKAQVRQAGSLLRTDLDMGDLEVGERGEERRGQRNVEEGRLTYWTLKLQ